VDRFTADYIHGGYQYRLLSNRCFAGPRRQSSLPVVRWLSILYIEVIRGLPLIGILFLAQVMLPLFLPPQFTRLDPGATSDRRTYLI